MTSRSTGTPLTPCRQDRLCNLFAIAFVAESAQPAHTRT